MPFWKGKQSGVVTEGRVSPHDSSDNEKGLTGGQQYSYESHGDSNEIAHVSDPADGDKSLHRDLTARQVSMIAIGGAIGTGLIIGTGSALVAAGPASILISYCLVGVLVYIVMAALGEMATWMPVAGGFANYAARYVDPALGFALGYST
jgi:amino acid transporter